eukprot:scaffold36108_cov26-Prasinocladus_malaysianus.AAC.1
MAKAVELCSSCVEGSEHIPTFWQGEDHESQKDGPGVLLVEKKYERISPSCWYIVPGYSGAVEMVPGREAMNNPSGVLGEVILCVKAPKRISSAPEMPLQL